MRHENESAQDYLAHTDYPVDFKMEEKKGYQKPKLIVQPKVSGKGKPPVKGEGGSRQPPVYKVG